MTAFPHFTPCFQWHPAVHDAWGGEDLWFCFFGFQIYDRGRVRKSLPRALEELGIRSYVLYELSGQYDVLARAWVPRSIPRFEKEMDNLERHLGGAVEAIKIDEVVHHWVWEESERAAVGRIKAPDKTTLQMGKPLRELDLLNRAQRADASGAESDGEFEDDERRELGTLLRDYQAERLISYPPYEPGIKFVVQVKVQQNRNQGDALSDTLCNVLTGAYGVIWDRSLYRSRSSHIQFMVFGRVRLTPEIRDDGAQSHPFHAVTPRLLDEISQAATLSGRRTYTFFLPREEPFLAYRDELSLPPPPDKPEPNAIELFGKREGYYFEVKGSVWTELDAWLKEEQDQPTVSKGQGFGALHNLVWAIVALLNSDGGMILVGALEPSKYGKLPRCKKLPRQGHYYCCGIDFDLADEDWDDFVRGLWALLCARIDPPPSARWLKLWEQNVHDRTVGMITIALPDDWYYVVDKTERRFVIRENAQTRLLQGPEVEKYQASHHRANRSANTRPNH